MDASSTKPQHTDPTPELIVGGQHMHVLRVLYSPVEEPGRTTVLHERALAIGREGPDGLVLDDSQVSRRHARIETIGPGRFSLTDLDSSNGVFVNALRIRNEELRDGDVIRVGAHILLFQSVDVRAWSSSSSNHAALHVLLGGSAPMRAVRQRIERVATHDGPVLLLGETGTGKELAARAVHALSNRGSGPFVAFNCGALQLELAKSELFGHVRGAFTHAISARAGYFETAQDGSIFLDELADLHGELQVALLRVLQDGTYNRLGETATQKTNARVIAATSRSLGDAVTKQGFREDLYFRLHVHAVELPPLRARRDDLPALVKHFLKPARIEPSCNAWEALCVHSWPGNVRELEHVLTAAATDCPEGVLELDDLPRELKAPFASRKTSVSGLPLIATLIDIPRDITEPSAEQLRRVFEHHEGNSAAVAKFFARDRKQVWRWLEKHGLVKETLRPKS